MTPTEYRARIKYLQALDRKLADSAPNPRDHADGTWEAVRGIHEEMQACIRDLFNREMIIATQ